MAYAPGCESSQLGEEAHDHLAELRGLIDPWSVAAVVHYDCSTVGEVVGDGYDGFDARDRILGAGDDECRCEHPVQPVHEVCGFITVEKGLVGGERVPAAARMCLLCVVPSPRSTSALQPAAGR